MKATILVPALAGVVGLIVARVFGVEGGLVQFVIGVGCMLIGALIVILMKRGGG